MDSIGKVILEVYEDDGDKKFRYFIDISPEDLFLALRALCEDVEGFKQILSDVFLEINSEDIDN